MAIWLRRLTPYCWLLIRRRNDCRAYLCFRVNLEPCGFIVDSIMREPTINEIKQTFAIVEQWAKLQNGEIVVSRWIEMGDGERRYLGSTVTPYKDVPIIIQDWMKDMPF